LISGRYRKCLWMELRCHDFVCSRVPVFSAAGY
jgi:hypothetical protein